MANTVTISLDTGRGPEPIEVDASLTLVLDPEELGRHIATMPSPQQAAVILGFYQEIDDRQLVFIGAEKAFDGDHHDPDLRPDVAHVLHVLAEAIEAKG